MSSTPLNEETVKNRYLIPYLLRLGFDISELSFENQFTIRIGRSEFQPSNASGRLDILVKRQDKNLFLVEAKREGKSLDQVDRDQAISYARLVDPVAPFVLVTNGDEFRRYDTLTKNDVSAGQISPDSPFELSLPASLVEEASSHFLGLSENNLTTFCRLQVEEEMRPLLGSKEESRKKYIPELFEERAPFSNAIDHFLARPKVLFALIADSGAGKTCCVCDLARRRVEKQPVLFYRGINLPGSLLDAIVSDFGWTFSESLSSVTLVRRLSGLVSGKQLLIVIDGIDEWEYGSRRQDLLKTVRRLATVRGIRLIVSCKSTVWHQFTTAKGQPTGLEEHLPEGSGGGGGFALQPMSSSEFRRVLDRYRGFYEVGRVWEDAALEEARRNPFFMRVAFEVASELGGEHIILDSVKFFSQYLKQALSRLEQPEAAQLLLVSMAGELLRQGTERLALPGLVRCAGSAYTNDLLNELIEFQLLERSPTDAAPQISFYFTLLRDFIVAFHSEQWQEIDDCAFRTVVDALGDSTTEQEALAFFYRHASPQRRRMIDADARALAGHVLDTYRKILSADLDQIRDRFVPYTKQRIGYVGTFKPGTSRLGFCNFRELRDGEEEILLVPAIGRRLYDSNLPHLYRAHGLVGVTAIGDRDVGDWTLNMAIGQQLRGIVEQGKLLESNDLRMVAESLAAVVSSSSFGYAGEPHPARLRNRPMEYPRKKPDLYPLDFAAVRKWMKYWLLYDHFKKKMVREKLASGEIPIKESEKGSSYSLDLKPEDMRVLHGKTESLLDLSQAEVLRIVGPIRERGLRDTYERVSGALETLEAHGLQELDDEVFPEHEILDRSGLRADPVCRYLERLYSMALEAFTALVERNFPTLYRAFPTIRWQPMTLVLAVELMPWQERHNNSVIIYLCRGASANRVIARPEDQIKITTILDPSWRFEIEVEGEKFLRCERDPENDVVGPRVSGQRHLYLSRALSPRSTYLGEDRHYQRSVGTRVPPILRTIVYDWLREELAVVFASLCSRYEVELEAREWDSFTRVR